jgi:predicted transcriptional regulator
MSTATLRLDESLRERIARLAGATDQTPHSFMVQALAEKVDEAEWKLAMQQQALQRDTAARAGEPVVEWHEMRDWLQRRVAEGAKPKRRK